MADIKEFKDEAAKAIGYDSFDDLFVHLGQHQLSTLKFSQFMEAVDKALELASQFTSSSTHRSVEKPNFEAMVIDWPWLKNGIQLETKEQAMQLMADLSSYIGNTVWNDQVLPLHSKLQEKEEDNQEWEKALFDCQKDINTLHSLLKSKESDLQTSTREVYSLNGRIGQLNSRIKELEEALAKIREWEAYGDKAVQLAKSVHPRNP